MFRRLIYSIFSVRIPMNIAEFESFVNNICIVFKLDKSDRTAFLVASSFLSLKPAQLRVKPSFVAKYVLQSHNVETARNIIGAIQAKQASQAQTGTNKPESTAAKQAESPSDSQKT